MLLSNVVRSGVVSMMYDGTAVRLPLHGMNHPPTYPSTHPPTPDPGNQPTSLPANQSISQSVNQSISQLVSLQAALLPALRIVVRAGRRLIVRSLPPCSSVILVILVFHKVALSLYIYLLSTYLVISQCKSSIERERERERETAS